MKKMNRPIYYQNYHKHTSQSHRYNKDSPLVHQDYFNYIKNNCSDVPQIYSTVEHGWQGVYFRVYNDLEKFNKDNNLNIKFIFGTEMYWVKNRYDNDKSNCHIILLAKNDNGRRAINKAISEAYKTGYYYKGRMDLDILLSLPKDDIFVTTACIAFWNKYDDIDNIVLQLNNHFSSFYLEVQPHHTDAQKKLNHHILDLHYKYNIPLIAGTDSHILDKNSYEDREDLLKSNDIHYDDEEGWFLDYPNVDEFIDRFEQQGILNQDEIYEAINNTNIILDFENIILDRNLKVPVLKKYQQFTQGQRNEIFINTLRQEWMKQQNDINKDKLEQYVQEIKHDIKEILDCNMADYFLDNYEIIKRGIDKYGGILTPTGRGSGVSMYLNKLLGFTKVDKVNASVLMYSERFLTATRINESHTPPDIDHNVSEREPFIQAQRDLLGEKGTYDLIALGTLKYKSAFKMYARAYDLDPQIANEVSAQISKYEEALKYAEDAEDKELIDIYDYVDEDKYGKLIEGCQQYKGIIDNVKGHPCFVGETLVLTQSGYKQIKDISVGENVFTHNGRLRTVLETTFKETNEILNVNIMGSPTIKTTSNHPFFVTKRRKHGSKDILLPYWKEARSLSKGDLIGIPINNESEIPTIETINTNNENFWWIIGRYIGDGWRSHTIRKSGEVGKKVKEIIICCNKNNNELNEITKNIEGIFNYWISKERTVYKIKFHNIHLYNYLDSFGDYAYGKKIPSDVLNLPINLLRSFLKGYFSADGYFNEKGNEQCITTVSKELAIGIIACINKAYERPCSFTIKALARKEMIEGRIVSCKEQYSVRFHYDERKQDGAFYNNNFLWMPFRCSEKIEQNEIVYNLSVNEDNSYTVNNLAVHNCGTICYDGDVESDIGIIMCKSETTGKETYTAVIESGTIDSFGYLKQDYLVVDSIGLIYDIYKEIGMKPLTINQLTKEIENNQKVWDIYKNGKTICINQCEQSGSTKKVMIYKPQNISELTQFIAGIRPSFKTMYKIFESRQHFEYGIKAFDNLLQDEYCQSSFILYQETLMKVLGFAGFPMNETYAIIKAISKKKKYVIVDAKKKFIPNFTQAILGTKETENKSKAKEMAEKVWQIIENSARYGFNSAHAYSMALDSVTLAWQKANYPLEFYKVTLQRYTNKGNKDKVGKLKKEMYNDGIKLNPIKFGDDNREFTIDREHNIINQTMASIKGMSKNVPIILYRLKDNICTKEDLMIYLITAKGEDKINSKSLEMLFNLDYFKCFGNASQLKYEYSIYNKFYTSKTITKSKLSDLEIKAIQGCFEKETDKQYRGIDNMKFINNLLSMTDIPKSTEYDNLRYQIELLGYTDVVIKSASIYEYAVENIEVDQWNRPWATLYNIRCGVSRDNIEINKNVYKGLEKGDIIKAIFTDKEIKKYMGEDDKGKKTYKKTGKTRRWVVKYEKESK